jgi:hypothetical protein
MQRAVPNRQKPLQSMQKPVLVQPNHASKHAKGGTQAPKTTSKHAEAGTGPTKTRFKACKGRYPTAKNRFKACRSRSWSNQITLQSMQEPVKDHPNHALKHVRGGQQAPKTG